MAWWQSGHAAACKAVYAGSIPTLASKFTTDLVNGIYIISTSVTVVDATVLCRGNQV